MTNQRRRLLHDQGDMMKISTIAVLSVLLTATVGRASPVQYDFFLTGNPSSSGYIVLAGPPASSSSAWAIAFSSNIDPNVLDFRFDFSSVGGPIVNLPQFNNFFPVPGNDLASNSGPELDSGTLIGDSFPDQGQWSMSSTPGFDQARWISGGGSTPTMLGDWRVVPEPGTLTLLALGGLAILRRRR
jgi:hypothetical protein